MICEKFDVEKALSGQEESTNANMAQCRKEDEQVCSEQALADDTRNEEAVIHVINLKRLKALANLIRRRIIKNNSRCCDR